MFNKQQVQKALNAIVSKRQCDKHFDNKFFNSGAVSELSFISVSQLELYYFMRETIELSKEELLELKTMLHPEGTEFLTVVKETPLLLEYYEKVAKELCFDSEKVFNDNKSFLKMRDMVLTYYGLKDKDLPLSPLVYDKLKHIDKKIAV